MNDASVTDLIALLQSESESIDTQFQLWITVTSAVVIASFAAGIHFSRQMQIFIVFMYTLASAAIGLRYANDASQFLFLHNELKLRGVDYPTVIDLRVLRTVVYICGTIATTLFVFARSRADTRNDTPVSIRD